MKNFHKRQRKSSGLNTSVSTYGKNNIRILETNTNWLNIRGDLGFKKNIFSDSDDSVCQSKDEFKSVGKLFPGKKHGLFSDSDKSCIITTSPVQPTKQKRVFAKRGREKKRTREQKNQRKPRKQSKIKEEIDNKLTSSTQKENVITKLLRNSVSMSPCYVDLSKDKHIIDKLTKGINGLEKSKILVSCVKEKAELEQLQAKPSSPTVKKSDKQSFPQSSSDLSSAKDEALDQIFKSSNSFSDNFKGFSVQVDCDDAINGLSCSMEQTPTSNKSSSHHWPLLNENFAKHVTKFRGRRRKNISFKITDGFSTYILSDAPAEANDWIASFHQSTVNARNETTFMSTSVINFFDKPSEISAFKKNNIIQSTPIVPRASNSNNTPAALHLSQSVIHHPSTPSFLPRQKLKSLVQEFASPLLTCSKSCRIFEETDVIPGKPLVEKSICNSRDQVLLECNQTEPVSFQTLYPSASSCTKLGEGVYGEVFRCLSSSVSRHIAVKVIPVEGSKEINGEKQKTFAQVLPEIINSCELSGLSKGVTNRTDAFISLFKVHCVIGQYPPHFLEAWDDYDAKRTSENDRPDVFDEDQLYIVFEFADGGIDIEHFQFRNATQAVTLVQQTVAGLAVAEEAYQFEHRDLHWGNILIRSDGSNETEYTCCGKTNQISTCGLRVHIIDFTLSRISKGGLCLYQDLSCDPDIFKGDASQDYQFEIYRMMRSEVDEDWSVFKPKTNVFWIYYLLDKCLNKIKYKNKRSKIHTQALSRLKNLHANVLQYKSCLHLLRENFFFKA
ncbi:uncharacterized protein LOC143449563 [Clavelina lepadiformis]|uniref:uncharacterized protein LOC143449563 n=1 Tax=Clavelina lepadiformis TaxID=159417 RepID=UPI00404347A3